MKHLFLDHPNEVGETYLQHLLSVLRISHKLAVAAHCQLLHGLFPFIKPPFNSDLESLIESLLNSLPEERRKRNLSEDEEELSDLYTNYGGD